MVPLSRRQFVGGAAKLGLAGGALALTSGGVLAACTDASAQTDHDVVPYTGTHQAGIITPAPGRLVYGAFDVTTQRFTDLRKLLRNWTLAIAALTQGQPIGAVEPANAGTAPGDTGEAAGSSPAKLTVTVGFGHSLFVRAEEGRYADRFGISDRLPRQLAEIPGYGNSKLDPQRSGGDLSLQCCSDDPRVAFHAFRNLSHIAHGLARVRWMQLGFGRTSTTSSDQSTPRNLMGFKDGTNNIVAQDATALRDHVWVQPGDRPEWMANGTFVVVRRIRILLDEWDRSSLDEQQKTIGRTKLVGSPLGARKEHDPPDLARLPNNAHIRLSAPAQNNGIRILRRGYSYADGVDSRTGELDAGLFFVAYQRDPRTQFVPLQQRLAEHDALNEYTRHESGAVFAIPPGVQPGEYLGQTLLG